jgi:hypothetical protein
MKKPPLAASLLLLIWPLVHGMPVEAYELATHENLTDAAITASQNVVTYMQSLGMDPTTAIDPASRAEDKRVFWYTGEQATPRGWMIEGAIREDDFTSTLPSRVAGCPQPENPFSPISRPLNHFYDVQRRGEGFTPCPPGSFCYSAPNWALGLEGRGPDDSHNRFTIPDARSYQLLSLAAPSKVDRDKNAALLFRSLGQLMHLVQDMAQPQHTRNDPHAGCSLNIGGEQSWFEKYIDARANNEPFGSYPSKRLKLDGFGPPAVSQYSDLWTRDGQKGLADFSSRNFFSAGTNLSVLPWANCGGLSQPTCNPNDSSYVQQGRYFALTTVDNQPVNGYVTWYTRTITDPVGGSPIVIQDPINGLPTQQIPISTRSIWDQALENTGSRAFSLNRLNYDAMSDILLPRAVGYSTALLDYFFRGKLDVDLIPSDPNDPASFGLTGTNSSAEALTGGTLTLYADVYGDPSAPNPQTPVRKPVLEATALPIGSSSGPVKPGDPLLTSPVAFSAPDAERYVAVYQGGLGSEKADVTGSSPGAVIGKVLGGVRVEEVFADETDPDPANWVWQLRTPTGVFRLPLSDSEYEEVAWGDAENTLVAHTPFGPDQPNQVMAYEVVRQPNSVEPVLEDTSQGPAVQLRSLQVAMLPFGLPLGTTVQLQHTVTYRQQLVTDERTDVYRWSNPADPHNGWYIWDHTDHAVHISTLVNRALPFEDTFTLVLDPAHLETWRNDTDQASYVWWVSEVAWTAGGHLLAVVGAALTAPPPARWAQESQPVFGLDSTGAQVPVQWCGAFACYPLSIGLRRTYPLGVDPLLWALVDLTDGRVLASTAEATLSITSAEAVEAPDWTRPGGSPPPVVYVHMLERRSGGSNPTPPGQDQDKGWTPVALSYPTGPLTLTDLTLETGEDLTAAGWLRPELLGELTRVGLFGTTPGFQPSPTELAFGGDGQGLRVLRPARPEWHPAQLGASLRARPAPGRERLVFQTEVGIGAGIYGDSVLVWDPAASRARHLARFPAGLETPSELWAATRDTALVRSRSLGQWVLLALEGDGAPRAFDDPTYLYDFTLLDPHALYEITSGKFYRAQPPAQRTPLPRTLAAFPGYAVWADYHAIRLP